MSTTFKPAFGLGNRHIQTLYSTFLRREKQPSVEVERFTLKDGDFLDAYWHKTQNSTESTPIVILFHGLAGSYKSPYIQGIMNALSDAGFNSVLMHFRSCSGEMNNLPRSYHSGETGDALDFTQSIQTRFPQAKLYAVGYSLGGNMLLKLLGELKDKSPFEAAVSVSAPLQLDICADAVNQGFSKFYQAHLVKNLNASLTKKFSQHDMESLIDIKVGDIQNLKTFWDFDGAYTAPVHGFDSAQDYYTKCSSKQYLKHITTKTLIIHSQDDPFMNTQIIPSKEELSPQCTLELSKYGGHVGFISGTLRNPIYWVDSKVVDFFKS